MWTQDKLYHPQNPKPRQIRPQARRDDHEHITVKAISISGRQYLAERLDYRSRELLADDIAQGQVQAVVSVHAYNPAKGWAKDISLEIAQLCFDRHGMTRSNADFLEDQLNLPR